MKKYLIIGIFILGVLVLPQTTKAFTLQDLLNQVISLQQRIIQLLTRERITTTETTTTTSKPITCTKELKICPDGTGVGRTGPKCEFTKCPVAVIDETSNWQVIFRNGYQIKKPANLKALFAGYKMDVAGVGNLEIKTTEGLFGKKLEDRYSECPKIIGEKKDLGEIIYTLINLSGKEFCKIKLAEGGMGHSYGNYGYITKIGDQFVVVTFALGVATVDFSKENWLKAEVLMEKIVSTLKVVDSSNWRTYKNEKYGFEFKYPETWFIREAPDKKSVNFSKTKFTINDPDTATKNFASFYFSNLNLGKEYSAPRYVSPQEYFKYLYPLDELSGWAHGNEITKEWINIAGFPVFHHLVKRSDSRFAPDNRYMMFTNDALYSFILYTGTNQQPTTYESNDDVVIKEIISTFSLKDKSKKIIQADR